MTVKIVRIGNSRGVRLPKALLSMTGIVGNLVEMDAVKGGIIIRPAARVRAGWDEAFATMAERGDDRLVEVEGWPQTEWDRRNWKW